MREKQKAPAKEGILRIREARALTTFCTYIRKLMKEVERRVEEKIHTYISTRGRGQGRGTVK